MKIVVETSDFAKGVVLRREREIDSTEVLKGNALFQSLKARVRDNSDRDTNQGA
jgi:hypothetical protein